MEMGHKNTEPSESLVIRLIMMEQLVCLSKAGIGYVGVNLCCDNHGEPKHSSDVMQPASHSYAQNQTNVTANVFYVAAIIR